MNVVRNAASKEKKLVITFSLWMMNRITAIFIVLVVTTKKPVLCRRSDFEVFQRSEMSLFQYRYIYTKKTFVLGINFRNCGHLGSYAIRSKMQKAYLQTRLL